MGFFQKVWDIDPEIQRITQNGKKNFGMFLGFRDLTCKKKQITKVPGLFI